MSTVICIGVDVHKNTYSLHVQGKTGNDVDLKVGWAYNTYDDKKYGNDTGHAHMTTMYVEGDGR